MKQSASLLLLPILYTAFFCSLAVSWLYIGQPHEDAYILFKYARNLADTGVISFNPAGERAEGATDFLYLVLVSFLTFLGLDVAISAVIVNAAGFLALIAMCVWLMKNAAGNSGKWRPLFLYLFPLLFLFTVTTTSSYGGFGTAAYAALNAGLFLLLVTAGNRDLTNVPLLSILVALWRPDGVIIGLAATVVGFLSLQDRAYRGRYLVMAGCAFLIGVAYLAVRWNYFGHALPLPLYVKALSDISLFEVISNLKVVLYLIPVTVAALILNATNLGRASLALSPFILHFTALLLTHQSQNVAYRFQAPIFAAILFCCFLGLLRRNIGTRKIIISASLIVVFAGMSANNFKNVWAVMSEDQYMWNFHPGFSKRLLPQDRIIVTEAGRIPFLSDSRFYDAVGLNTPYTAKNSPDIGWIRSTRPDIIMFHQAGMLSIPPRNVDYFEVNCDELWAYAKIQFRDRPPAAGLPKTHQAALYLTRFLAQAKDQFNCIAVRYQGGFNHIYGLRRGHHANRWLIELLKQSFAGERMSYFDLMREAHR